MTDTVAPAGISQQAEVEHPPWCDRTELSGRSHRSRPRTITTDWGQQTVVFLERSADFRGRELPTLLMVEQLHTCPEPVDSDHDAHECQEPNVVGLRMPEARRFLADVMTLLEDA